MLAAAEGETIRLVERLEQMVESWPSSPATSPKRAAGGCAATAECPQLRDAAVARMLGCELLEGGAELKVLRGALLAAQPTWAGLGSSCGRTLGATTFNPAALAGVTLEDGVGASFGAVRAAETLKLDKVARAPKLAADIVPFSEAARVPETRFAWAVDSLPALAKPERMVYPEEAMRAAEREAAGVFDQPVARAKACVDGWIPGHACDEYCAYIASIL